MIRGDLDWIVMKALEKDRNRRYGSPGSFAEEVARYLNNEPVTAHRQQCRIGYENTSDEIKWPLRWALCYSLP